MTVRLHGRRVGLDRRRLRRQAVRLRGAHDSNPVHISPGFENALHVPLEQ